MARLRTPWWMYLFAASFLATFSMIVYNDLFGPEQAGISAEYRSGAMVVTEVQPGSSGEQAGLKVNDRVAFVDGQPVHNFADWMGLRTNFEAATPHRLEIGRNDQTLQSTLVLRRQQPFQNWRTTSQQRSPAFRGSQFLILLLAFVIAFNKPHDAVARIGAWLAGSAGNFQSSAAVWIDRSLAAPALADRSAPVGCCIQLLPGIASVVHILCFVSARIVSRSLEMGSGMAANDPCNSAVHHLLVSRGVHARACNRRHSNMVPGGDCRYFDRLRCSGLCGAPGELSPSRGFESATPSPSAERGFRDWDFSGINEGRVELPPGLASGTWRFLVAVPGLRFSCAHSHLSARLCLRHTPPPIV